MSQRQSEAIKAWWAKRFESGEKQRQAMTTRKLKFVASPEEILEHRRALYARDAEKHRAREKADRAANPEKCRQYERARYERTREKQLAAQRVWREKNRDRVRANARRRDALKAATAVGPVDYALVMASSGGICGICNEAVDTTNPKAYHYDHVVPLARGGGHVQANIQLAHARCNMQKHARIA